MVTPEQEAIIRQIDRRCAGPLIVPEEVQKVYFDRLAAGEDAADVLADYLAAATEHGYPLVNVPEGDDFARRTLLASLRKRTGCGADFNAVVLAGELDGAEHEYECPKCGNRGRYTAPLFE